MPSIFKKVENLIKKSLRHKISLEALQVVTYKLTNDSIAYRFDETFNVLPLPHIYKVHFCDSYQGNVTLLCSKLSQVAAN